MFYLSGLFFYLDIICSWSWLFLVSGRIIFMHNNSIPQSLKQCKRSSDSIHVRIIFMHNNSIPQSLKQCKRSSDSIQSCFMFLMFLRSKLFFLEILIISELFKCSCKDILENFSNWIIYYIFYIIFFDIWLLYRNVRFNCYFKLTVRFVVIGIEELICLFCI